MLQNLGKMTKWRNISQICRNMASHMRNTARFGEKMRNLTKSGEKWQNSAKSSDILVKSGKIWQKNAKFGGPLTKFGEIWRGRVWWGAFLTLVCSDFIDIWRLAIGGENSLKIGQNTVFWPGFWKKDLQIATPDSPLYCFSWKFAQRYF